MPPALILDEEDYASSEDSDFAPDDAPEREGEAESSGDEEAAEDGGTDTRTTAQIAPAPSAGRKRRQQETGGGGGGGGDTEDAEDAGFENSGDEAIIEKGRKRRKKAQRDQDDEGGAGGLIKTRSMRAVEKAERKAQVAAGPVTVDVDALWASMSAAPVLPAAQKPRPAAEDAQEGDADRRGAGAQQPGAEAEPGDMIKIRRTYNFAGKVHTEERLVPRESAEARLYLASKGSGAGDPSAAGAAADGDGEGGEPERRMPRKAFRSVFEPVVASADSQRTDLNLGIAVRLQAREKAKKLNTVEKSRMDWAGFVDKEGIKDELALAGRAKGSYADRQDFLARTEARREDDARRLRLAGKA